MRYVAALWMMPCLLLLLQLLQLLLLQQEVESYSDITAPARSPALRNAVVSIVGSSDSALGAIVLARSLIATGSIDEFTDLVLLVPKYCLDVETLSWLNKYWIIIYPPENPTQYLHREEERRVSGNTAEQFKYSIFEDRASFERKHNQMKYVCSNTETFLEEKVYCWRLKQYSKIMVIENDSFLIKKVDYFNNHNLWKGRITGVSPLGVSKDFFSTVIFLIHPSDEIYNTMVQSMAMDKDASPTAEHDILNKAFHSDWMSKPDIERIDSNDIIVETQCALAHYEPPRFSQPYNDLLKTASLFSFQGKNKPWKLWPKNFTFDICKTLIPFANLWTAMAMTDSIDAIREMLSEFVKKGELSKQIIEKTLKQFKEFYIAGNNTELDREYAKALVSTVKNTIPIELQPQDWGKKKSKFNTRESVDDEL